MRNFRPTNSHGSTFAPNQWLHHKEATEWRAQKCNALVGAETALTCAGSQTTPFHGGEVHGREGWYCVCTKAMLTLKGTYGYGEPKYVIALSMQ